MASGEKLDGLTARLDSSTQCFEPTETTQAGIDSNNQAIH